MPEQTPDQSPLFGAPAPAPAGRGLARRAGKVAPAPVAPELAALAHAMPPRLHLGTSSWSFPGWKGLVWAGDHAESKLAKEGLTAYAEHPLLTSVSLDRAFYRPLGASEYLRTFASSSRRRRWCAMRWCAPRAGAAWRPTRRS